jgi:hypothetical protein
MCYNQEKLDRFRRGKRKARKKRKGKQAEY